MEDTLQLGLIGVGTVGTGVIKILQENASDIEARLGARVRLKRAAVLDLRRVRDAAVDPALLTTDPVDVLDDPAIAIVIELIGGIEPARTYILRAIANGKHVVTANKALLATHGDEIFAAAQARGVDIYFEGAVAGGIPIIRSLREALASDRIESMYGIINGTCNFILSAMAGERAAYADVLARAQSLGYAEADPTLDVEGHDTAHKLALLVALGFGTRIRLDEIHTEGITRIEPVDFLFAHEFGYRIKLLAIAKSKGGVVEARVHPTMIPTAWLLAGVDGAFNAVYVRSYALGPLLFYGMGAGMMPTGSAVVADAIDLCRNVRLHSAGRVPGRAWGDRAMRALPVVPMGDVVSRYYLRFTVQDRPGVLARIAGVLGDKGISIEQMVQRSRGDAPPVDVVMLTHEARESAVQAALTWIDTLEFVAQPTRLIRIEDGKR
jgi:homoserine dehydrogenase